MVFPLLELIFAQDGGRGRGSGGNGGEHFVRLNCYLYFICIFQLRCWIIEKFIRDVSDNAVEYKENLKSSDLKWEVFEEIDKKLDCWSRSPRKKIFWIKAKKMII